MSQKLLIKFENLLQKLKNKIQPRTEQVLAGIYPDEKSFLSAIKGLKQKGYKNFSAVTPCPVHGLEELLEIKRSWIPWVTFVFGSVGCLFGLWFTWWTSAVDWPLIIGGKPFWSLPAFIPVIFECTILLGALSSVGALFYACGIPCVDPPVLDKDLTSHKFAVYFKLNHTGLKFGESPDRLHLEKSRPATENSNSIKDKTQTIKDLEKDLKALGAEKTLLSEF